MSHPRAVSARNRFRCSKPASRERPLADGSLGAKAMTNTCGLYVLYIHRQATCPLCLRLALRPGFRRLEGVSDGLSGQTLAGRTIKTM